MQGYVLIYLRLTAKAIIKHIWRCIIQCLRYHLMSANANSQQLLCWSLNLSRRSHFCSAPKASAAGFTVANLQNKLLNAQHTFSWPFPDRNSSKGKGSWICLLFRTKKIAADFTPISKYLDEFPQCTRRRLTWIPRSQIEVREVDDVIVLLLESNRIN